MKIGRSCFLMLKEDWQNFCETTFAKDKREQDPA